MLVREAVYRKRRSADDEGCLAQEARALTLLRHPGVVALAAAPGDNPEELVLRVVPGGDLRGRTFSAEEVAGLGAAAATTVADLHDLGAAHNALRAEHVLLDRSGAPVLCGFGHVSFASDPRRRAEQQAGDVADLVDVLVALLRERGTPLQRRLARTARQRHRSARALARTLAETDGARLPSPSLEDGSVPSTRDGTTPEVGRHGPSSLETQAATPRADRPRLARAIKAAGIPIGRGPRSRRLAVAAVALCGVGVVAGVVTVTTAGEPSHGASCPAVDAGCKPLATPAGVLALADGRWQVGHAGRVVAVLGRWRCGGVLPAVLQPTTGQIWVFDRWARADADVTGRPVARVAGATSLVVLPGRSCDGLVALGPGTTRHVVAVRQAP